MLMQDQLQSPFCAVGHRMACSTLRADLLGADEFEVCGFVVVCSRSCLHMLHRSIYAVQKHIAVDLQACILR